jgi:hypothetical protein
MRTNFDAPQLHRNLDVQIARQLGRAAALIRSGDGNHHLTPNLQCRRPPSCPPRLLQVRSQTKGGQPAARRIFRVFQCGAAHWRRRLTLVREEWTTAATSLGGNEF